MKVWHVVVAGVLAACASVVIRAEFAVSGDLGLGTPVMLGVGALLIGLVMLTTLPEKR